MRQPTPSPSPLGGEHESILPAEEGLAYAPMAVDNRAARPDAMAGGRGGVSPPPPGNIHMIMRIPVSVKVVLGSATMPVAQLVKLGRGAVIPLDRRVGEPVDVVVNGQTVARGEIVVVDENGQRFGVSLTEVLARASRQAAD